MRTRIFAVALAIVAAASALAPGAGAVGAQPVPRASPRELPHIEDNSFLAEEAFNQEAGVVQHISQFTQARGSRAWQFTFTQEWPLGGVTHQLSYTIPFGRGDPGPARVGDLLLNYRYQLLADDGRGSFIAPRLSVSLPTGAWRDGLGMGAVGVQALVPFSQQLGPAFISHLGAGYTYFGATRDGGGAAGTVGIVNLAHSIVWLARPRLNLLLETVWTGSTRAAGGTKSRKSSLLLNPGVRWSHDFPSGLQIVPGLSFPIGVGPSSGERQVLVYLSFEHPFTAHR
jgi:hypothetical protein